MLCKQAITVASEYSETAGVAVSVWQPKGYVYTCVVSLVLSKGRRAAALVSPRYRTGVYVVYVHSTCGTERGLTGTWCRTETMHELVRYNRFYAEH